MSCCMGGDCPTTVEGGGWANVKNAFTPGGKKTKFATKWSGLDGISTVDDDKNCFSVGQPWCSMVKALILAAFISLMISLICWIIHLVICLFDGCFWDNFNPCSWGWGNNTKNWGKGKPDKK